MINQDIIGISPGFENRLPSIFCEKIIPLSSALEVPEEIRVMDINLPDNYPGLKELRYSVIKDILSAGRNKELIANIIEREHNARTYLYHKYLTENGIRSIPFFTDANLYSNYLVQGNAKFLELTFSNVPIINISEITWDHIKELRNNKDFKKKLRNFRLFFQDNYNGKEPNYIIDSLHQKIDEYEEICKLNGIKLILSSFSQILSSRSLLGALSLTVIGILTDNPNLITLSSIGGSIIEVGKVSLHIAEKKLEYEEKVANNGLAYLMDLKKVINKNK